MNSILEKVSKIGLMPVIKLEDVSKATDLAKALIDGGIPVAEVTFRAKDADKAIAAIAKAYPDMLVGAGTVINIEQVKLAVAAGAKYIVSPGFVPEVVQYCLDNDICVIPGCTNASEISVASNMGLEVVKFFPAEAMGGLKVLKAMAGPFGKMRYIPTGGISPKNLSEYLSFKKIICVGGSWMVPGDLVAAGDWAGITALAKEAVVAMLELSIVHIGINSATPEFYKDAVKGFSVIMGQDAKEGGKSAFVGPQIEIMKEQGRGTFGHLALGCTSLERAVNYFEAQGMKFDYDTAKYNDYGEMVFIYFTDEFGGFGVHLVRK